MDLEDVAAGTIVYASEGGSRGLLTPYRVIAGPREHRGVWHVQIEEVAGSGLSAKTVPVRKLVHPGVAEALPPKRLTDRARVRLIEQGFAAAGLKPNSPRGYRVRKSGFNPLFTLTMESAETLLRQLADNTPDTASGDDGSPLIEALGLDS